MNVFRKFGIAVSISEARQFMGLEKKEHVRSMCRLEGVIAQWQEKYGREPNESDVDAIYAETEPMMVQTMPRHTDPIPGTLDFTAAMRTRGIKIGSCIGYTSPMMAALVPEAAQRGYSPDETVCASDVPAGRPEPWMCYLNAINLKVRPFKNMVKIGDTLSDIEEGLNAGMWTIGLTQSGKELGLTREEAEALPEQELDQRLQEIELRYRQAGVHYVAKGIWECLPLIDEINTRLSAGELPTPR